MAFWLGIIWYICTYGKHQLSSNRLYVYVHTHIYTFYIYKWKKMIGERMVNLEEGTQEKSEGEGGVAML